MERPVRLRTKAQAPGGRAWAGAIHVKILTWPGNLHCQASAIEIDSSSMKLSPCEVSLTTRSVWRNKPIWFWNIPRARPRPYVSRPGSALGRQDQLRDRRAVSRCTSRTRRNPRHAGRTRAGCGRARSAAAGRRGPGPRSASGRGGDRPRRWRSTPRRRPDPRGWPISPSRFRRRGTSPGNRRSVVSRAAPARPAPRKGRLIFALTGSAARRVNGAEVDHRPRRTRCHGTFQVRTSTSCAWLSTYPAPVIWMNSARSCSSGMVNAPA